MITKDAIAQAELEVKIREIKRKEKLVALNDYIGFGVSKIFGAASLGTGVAEIMNHHFHPISSMPPESIVGLGLSTLAGPKVIHILSKFLDSLKP